MLGWFRRYVRRYLRKHFHRVSLLRGTSPDVPDGQPLIVIMNHPSWWDPMLALFFSSHFFPERDHFGPIDARALERYGILRKLGFFGVELGSPRGAKAFLDSAKAVLGRPGTGLWLTPQGEFADPRTRPLHFKPGLGHLAKRLGSGQILPLAVDYVFWEERLPEALAAFGEPIDLAAPSASAEQWNSRCESSLEAAQDKLAEASSARRDEAFEQLLGGRGGVGGVYDHWRRWVARVRGDKFDPRHGAIGDQTRPAP